MSTFDVYDRAAWYFGPMSRQDATDLLMSERESGVFLVRDSTTIVGDFVLCVREDSKVSHYIINKIPAAEDCFMFRIGDQTFSDLPDLLTFYKLHYLDTTPLRRPAIRRYEKVIGKFDFEGSDPDDLPFKKGEILEIISKDEEQWWTARNSRGQTGQIPVPYVTRYEDNIIERPPNAAGAGANSLHQGPPVVGLHHSDNSNIFKSNLNRQLPALARVKQERVPNAYDETALKLNVGDVIKVIKTNINGQWEGELRGKVGHFPFTHVEFIDGDVQHWSGQ
ncbi:adapter molecule Crk isoform X1 [Topomyia yanbarensis]|uniref:adapter molecule Crk isoform X1 n=1 Tax=Topomyia yanbarensis TaxID=2498891 RepID=UPI00273A76CA|nr:adapter molecule Crk isoform X1 [Topomyia yanbarensis]XP_058815351.1 adapter molecule Crk isoform X1 [Topomyia yanbarensis]